PHGHGGGAGAGDGRPPPSYVRPSQPRWILLRPVCGGGRTARYSAARARPVVSRGIAAGAGAPS
ncbi:MAG: hypothetical protein ACRD03_05900, partial [Acidimicrobiales bacterium]